MKEITINCAGLTQPAELYALLSKTLEFPEPCGQSPDALYESLVALSQETRVTIFGLDTLEFGEEFRSTLLDAEADNFWLNISIA